MAKEMEAGKEHEGKKHKRHLHEIRSVQAEDGSIVHHHTYKTRKEDPHTEGERQNVATSGDAEEAGQHVADQFGMNQQAGQDESEPAPDEGAGGGAAETMPQGQ